MYNREFQIRFLKDPANGAHVHNEVDFLFVLEGELKVQVFHNTYVLKSEDFMVVNSNHRQVWTAIPQTMVCMLSFDRALLYEQIDKKHVFFHCNSTTESDSRYEYVRGLMSQLLSECAISTEKMTFRKKSLVYELLDYLLRFFIIDETVEILSGEDLRMERMLEYIHDHYSQGVSLTETADYMYMAASSFSRYFKRTVGVNFLEYVNQLRLHYAAEDLCYTNQSIAWISENHGFTNPSAFCRIFKNAYKETPAAYRKKFEDRKDHVGIPEKELHSYLKKYADQPVKSVSNYKTDIVRIECSALQYETWENPWNRGMNLGFAHELLNAVIQNQVLSAKNDIGFSQGRICAVFSEKMMLRQGHDPRITNYIYLDIVLDFLVKNGIAPIISIDNKQESIIQDVSHILYESPEEIPFENLEELLAVMKDFLEHILRRYSMAEVSHWTFECWYDLSRGTLMGLSLDYVDAYEKISSLIRHIIPDAKVGGWGISSVAEENRDVFSAVMEKWSRSKCPPDFISLNLFPYFEGVRADEKHHSRRLLNNAEYYSRAIGICRKKMEDCGFADVPIYVAEWNTSISKRNYYNDTCGKAAMMLQMISELKVQIACAAYMELPDLSGVYHDSIGYLFGGRGLINMYGGRKPSYYGLMFLNKLKPKLIFRDSHVIVTTDGFGTYTVLCFNARRLKYDYYRRNEGEIQLDELEKLFEDQKNLEITFRINHVENGTYNMDEYRVRPQRGSLLHEWMRMGQKEELNQYDYQYLREVVQPERRRSHLTVTQGKMVFLQKLMKNEIRLIKLSK